MSFLIAEHIAVVETGTFKSKNARRLYEYIVDKRGARARPSLSDIDLMDLYDIAPSLCIRDVVGNGEDLRCRFWGTEFERAYKMNCTGKLVSESYDAGGIENTLALHKRALASQTPLRLIGNLGYADKTIDHVTFEGIMTCVDGKDRPKQHIFAVGQFGYGLDDEDRTLLKSQNAGFFF